MDKVVDDYNIQLVNYLFCLELKSLFAQNNFLQDIASAFGPEKRLQDNICRRAMYFIANKGNMYHRSVRLFADIVELGDHSTIYRLVGKDHYVS